MSTFTPTIQEIKRMTADVFGVEVPWLDSARRAKTIARPRQVVMYLAKQHTARSYPEIGHSLGGRDHSTVMHGVKKIEELLETDGDLAAKVNMIETALFKACETRRRMIAEDMEDAARDARLAAVHQAKTMVGATLKGKAAEIRKALFQLFGERVTAKGYGPDGDSFELLVSPDGRWSLLEIDAEGERGFLAVHGGSWKAVRADLPAPRAPLAGQARRDCLKCHKPFHSTGPENRVCTTCKRLNGNIDTAMAERGAG